MATVVPQGEEKDFQEKPGRWLAHSGCPLTLLGGIIENKLFLTPEKWVIRQLRCFLSILGHYLIKFSKWKIGMLSKD